MRWICTLLAMLLALGVGYLLGVVHERDSRRGP